MDSKTVLVRAEQGIHILARRPDQGQTKPVDAVNQHAQPRAQIACHDVQQPHLPTVRVEQHQLAHAGGGHALAQFGPEADHRLGLERQGARKQRMFGAEPDRLGR